MCRGLCCTRRRKAHAPTVVTVRPPQEAAIAVTINPEKPRKGCLYAAHTAIASACRYPRSTPLGSEVRLGDKVVLSLLDLPRPFLKLKALEMEDVAKAVIKETKA